MENFMDWFELNKQIIINIIEIIILPIVAGFAFRVLFKNKSKGYFVTVALACLSLVMLVLCFTVNTYGNEGLSLLTLMSFLSLAASLLSGLIIRLVNKIKKN